MKYCSKCGKEINENAVICVHCGCSVEETKSNYVKDSKKLNVLALIGFIVSLASLLISLVGITAIVGIIFSGIALKQIGAGTDQKGKGFAITGLVVGICSLVYTLIAVLILGTLVGALV